MDYLRLGGLRMGAMGVAGFEETGGYNYATMDISSGKPTIQAIGETLSQITLNIAFSSRLGHDIPAVIKQLDDMRRSGTPQLLVFADGVYQGNYVLTERSTVILRTSASGTIQEAEMSLSLLEYSDRVLVNRRNTESRSSGEPSNRKITEK